MLPINVKADFKPLQKAFIALGAKQVPFATSLALTALAKGVAAEETKTVDATFKSPTPFTERAFRIEVATKSKPIAVVAIKDIQANYLAPYIVGGPRFLGTKKGMLAPRAIALNQYGNLPKNKLRSLQGKPNIYIGPIKTKSGRVISGVWQRSAPSRVGRGRKGAAKAPDAGKLKLLIQFEDTTPAPKHLAYFERAQAYLKKNAAREMTIAMRRALSTAR
jgi:hypothetical protein